MATRFTFIILCALIGISISGQNLIRDGGFEEIECPRNPINSISDVDPWYTTGADAYLLQVNCPFDPVASADIVALKDGLNPFRGVTYISLESGLSASGYFLTEGMGIELIQPLKQGYFYFFDLAYVNYEDVLNINFDIDLCDPSPTRPINLLIAEEKIYIRPETRQAPNGFIITDVTTNGRIVLTDTAPNENNFKINTWTTFWDCFEANGEEKHLAVTGNNGISPTSLNCFDTNSSGFLYQSGHAIDEIRLYEIPMSIDTIIRICPGGIDINLFDIVDAPYAEKAGFLWNDGFENTLRTINAPGVFKINMILPCVTVPITLNIEEIPCRADIYVGNIFTPNNDGINDVILPNIASVLPITSYSFSIYNRWGQQIFLTKDTSTGWHGMINQNAVGEGVYVWVIKYSLGDGTDQLLFEKGDITLLR